MRVGESRGASNFLRNNGSGRGHLCISIMSGACVIREAKKSPQMTSFIVQ